MIGKEMVGQKNATLSESLHILEEREKEGQLGFEQQATLDYLKKFAKLPKKKADELREELVKIEGVTEAAACKIVDMLPKTEDQLNAILSSARGKMGEKTAKEVLELVGKYNPKEPKE
ncbi:RNA polymerase Rpb4 [Candidatus Gugararchaeum adminiculabundum]|nr:RNA polymerase Rpb4 [Candidatus Gugararchaeum adminiculabundum]